MADLPTGTPALKGAPDLTVPSEQPAHARIEQWLESLITSGRLRPDDKLPAEVDVAASLGVSRMTLRQALASLETKGLIVRRRGRWGGNFVAEPRFEVELSGLPGLTEQMRRAHVRAGARLLEAETRRPTAHVQRALQLPRGAQVHVVVRIRSANREPIALEESYYPAELYPDLLTRRLQGSIYALLRDYGRAPHSALERLEPVKATVQQAELLGIAPEDPLMLVERTACSEDGVPVEHAFDYFRADRTRITLRTQVGEELRSEVRPRRR